MKDLKDIRTIENNYDNLEIIEVCDYLLGVVINDIELMNDLVDEKEEYDLGNNHIIKNDDLESIVSIIETLKHIEYYNYKK